MNKCKIVSMLSICMLPIISYSATDDSSNSADSAYESCVEHWNQGLTKNNPDLSAIDVKYLAAYYCLCAFDIVTGFPKSITTADKQKQTFNQCMPYAVLRNTLHYDLENDSGEKINPGPKVLQNACKGSFPNPTKDPESVDLIAKFCACASEPLASLKARKTDLTEDQIKVEVQRIEDDCVLGEKEKAI